MAALPDGATRGRIAWPARAHWPALAALALANLIAQGLILSHAPAIRLFPDSQSYLAAAAAIASRGQLVTPFRTPGYPLYLALLFLLSGGRHLGVVVASQAALSVAASVEVYALASALTRHRALACLAAVLVAINPYIANWEICILTESLAYFLTVSLCLVAWRLMRRPRPGGWVAFSAIGLALVMVRPFFVYLPALALVALWLWRARATGRRVPALGPLLSLAATTAGILGYMLANAALYGYFGLTDVTSVNVLGNLMEHHLQGLPVPARFAIIQRQANAWVAGGSSEPWYFAAHFGYGGHFYVRLGAFAAALIERHPLAYAVVVLRDMLATWRAVPTLYTPYPPAAALGVLVVAGALTLAAAYALFPLAALLALVQSLRRTRDAASFFVALLGLLVLSDLAVTGAAAYDEFYRLRSVVDWAAIVVVVILAGVAADWLADRFGARAVRQEHTSTVADALPAPTPARAMPPSRMGAAASAGIAAPGAMGRAHRWLRAWRDARGESRVVRRACSWRASLVNTLCGVGPRVPAGHGALAVAASRRRL